MKRLLLRTLAVVTLLLTLTAAVLVSLGWRAFGASASGSRRERMEASPQWAGRGFENPQPLWNDYRNTLLSFADVSPVATPSDSVAVEPGTGERFREPPHSGLRITWLGHSTVFVEVDGVRLLTDPMFSDRASPFTFVGPKRWYPPPIPLNELPVDAVLISHDHYDHLDEATVRALRDRRFFVPLGVGAHLEYWGVPAANITELDWWQEGQVGEVRVISTPARHASGRHLLDQGATLWTSWSMVGKSHRIFYSGDTGLFPGMRDIGERLGPFDVAMVEVGQYHRAWPDWHIGPEQAVEAASMVRARLFFPVHWGLFTLAMHGWTEPIERARAAAELRGMPMVAPRPGQSIDPGAPPADERWWPKLKWKTAQQDPIVSTRLDGGSGRAER